jgi:hypothetical protein
MSEIKSGSQARMEKVKEIADYLIANPKDKPSDVMATISAEYGVTFDKAREYYNSAQTWNRNKQSFKIRKICVVSDEQKRSAEDDAAGAAYDRQLEKDMRLIHGKTPSNKKEKKQTADTEIR